MTPYERDFEFRRLIDSNVDGLDLATVALEIARDEYADLDVHSWRSRLDQLGSGLGRSARGSPENMIRQINEFLYGEQGYQGNRAAYYDPRNSFLNDVMERKLGIPITLSIIYMAVARCVGLRLLGVAMPAHFIVKYNDQNREIFVDPFHRGTILSREECAARVSHVVGVTVTLSPDQLEPAAPDQIVLRLLGNLKSIYLGKHDVVRALRVQQRICAVNQSDLCEQRDLGALYLRNKRPGLAIEPLERYVTDMTDARDRDEVASLIGTARRMVAAMN